MDWSNPWTREDYHSYEGSTYQYGFVKTTVDEIHPGPPYLTGGPFQSIEIENIPRNSSGGVFGSGTYLNRNGDGKFVGGFNFPSDFWWDRGAGLPYPSSPVIPPNSSLFPNTDDLRDQAWHRTKPQLEQSGLYVFLKESHDIPRMLESSARLHDKVWRSLGGSSGGSEWRMTPKFTADQFLNQQFGWMPFISDVVSFLKTCLRMNDLLIKLSKENGQWIRRRVPMVQSVVDRVIDSGSSLAMPCYAPHGLWPDFFSATPSYELSEHIVTNASSSGKFRYYRPEFDLLDQNYHSSLNSVLRYLTLYGLRVTPSNLYRATPWTWLIDWVSNVGRHIEKFSDQLVDSMQAQYLYLMHSERRERRLLCKLPFWQPGMLSLEFRRVITTKQRVEADGPYGFGLSWDNLTPRQLAIAAALGITRR